MLRRFTCFIVVLLIAIVSQAAPSSKYTMIVTFADGHTSKYALNNQPKLLWEDDSVYISSGIIRLGVVYNALHSITFTQDSAGENGDVNGDGTTDTQDVLHIYDYMKNGTSQYDEQALDVNGDGYIDTQDVLLVYDAMRVAAKRRAIPSKTSSSGIDQMVVVTWNGALNPCTIDLSTDVTYQQQNDTIIVSTNDIKEYVHRKDMLCIYFEDKRVIDAEPYIEPQEDDFINPNLITPDSVAYEVTKLDTLAWKARLKFAGKVPDLYLGQIYTVQNDTVALGLYILTYDKLNEHEVDVCYRPALYTEMIYNTILNVSSTPDEPFFSVDSVIATLGPMSAHRVHRIPVNEMINVDSKAAGEKMPAIAIIKTLYNIFENSALGVDPSINTTFSPDCQLVTGPAQNHENFIRRKLSQIQLLNFVLRGGIKMQEKFKLNLSRNAIAGLPVFPFEKKLFSFGMSPLVPFAPNGAPIMFRFEPEIWSFLDAKISGESMYANTMHQDLDAMIGVRYNGITNDLKPIISIHPHFYSETPTVDASIVEASITPNIYAKLNLRFYGIFRLYFDIMPVLPTLSFQAIRMYDKFFWQLKVDVEGRVRIGFNVDLFDRTDKGLNVTGVKHDALQVSVTMYKKNNVISIPDKLVNLDSLKAVWAGFKVKNTFEVKVKGLLENDDKKVDCDVRNNAAIAHQSFSDFPWQEAAETPLDGSYLDEMNQVIDVGGNMNMIKARMPENIRKRMPQFRGVERKADYDLVAQLPKPVKAPLRMSSRRAEIETGAGGLAEGLRKAGEPWATVCDENSVAHVEANWPTPIGYKNVLRTSILDGKGKPVMSIDREMPWEIKNFDATWTGSEDGHGTINYRNGGENITEVVVGADGSVKFIYNRSSGKTTVITADMSATLPQRMLPGTSCMGSPDITVPGNETFSFKGFCSAWDMMYWQAENLERNPYVGQATFGTKEYLGYPCKYITTSDGTVYFWQNLCLCATGEATFKVTSLTILDELDNPTVTVRHDEEE